MPRVRFTADFDCRLGLHTVRAYKAGMEILVSQECASKAVAEDKAVLLLDAEAAVVPETDALRVGEPQPARRPRRPRREVV